MISYHLHIVNNTLYYNNIIVKLHTLAGFIKISPKELRISHINNCGTWSISVHYALYVFICFDQTGAFFCSEITTCLKVQLFVELYIFYLARFLTLIFFTLPWNTNKYQFGHLLISENERGWATEHTFRGYKKK